MKTLTIKTQDFTNAAVAVQAFVPKEGEYVGKVVVSGLNGKLEVKANNNVQQIVVKNVPFTSSDITDDTCEPFSLDAKKLLTALRNAKGVNVNMELHSEHVVLKSGRSKVKIDTLAETQEIVITKGAGSEFDFTPQLAQLGQVLHAVDVNNPRYELNGVLMEINKGVFSIVGTNTKRLVSLTSRTQEQDMRIVVPKQSVTYITKLFNKLDATAEVSSDRISVFSDFIDFSTKLISADYPDWKKIMPKDFEQSIVLERVKMIELIKEAAIFHSKLTVSIKEGKIKLTDIEKETEVIDDFEAEANIFFGIDSNDVLDFLESTDEEYVNLRYNQHNLPVMFEAHANYKEVMMPYISHDMEEAVA